MRVRYSPLGQQFAHVDSVFEELRALVASGDFTLGKPVLMGRKTYLSLSIKPLPGRTNIVVSRDRGFAAPGVLVAPRLETALQAAGGDAMRRGADAIMVIGGAEIYAQALPLASRLEITQVQMKPDGDAVFPPIDAAVWRETARTPWRRSTESTATATSKAATRTTRTCTATRRACSRRR